MIDESARPAIILFAHGARDPRWAEPFLRVAERVRAAAPDLALEVAYLEHLEPNLAEAARRLAHQGAKAIRVVPLFIGRGGHLRVEVPAAGRRGGCGAAGRYDRPGAPGG